MRNLSTLLLLSFAFASLTQAATPAPTAPAVKPAAAPPAVQWREGQHYFLVKPAAPTTVAPGKVEVTEVFSYGCPACYQFYPTAEKLKAALPKNAVMTYYPASWNTAESWPLFQRAYLTAEALGVAEKAHAAMFKAIWEGDELAVTDRRTNRIKNPPPTMEKVAAFYERVAGVKKEEFLKASKSFSIETSIPRTEAAIKATKADQTPTMVINGKYRFTAQSAGGDNEVIELAKYLIAKETK